MRVEGAVVEAARRALTEGLSREAEFLNRMLALPRPRIGGRLYRPLVARAAAGTGTLPEAFWSGALAIQFIHEASLLHDDILDDCSERRGIQSMAARDGIMTALVEGDHLLTAGTRAAARTRSLPFVERFARAVERTVAGEKAQGAARGRWLSEAEYREIAAQKSGELFGCAAALAASLRGDESLADRDVALGSRIGTLYQMVDDFLDLCPSADLGKPPLLDLAQRKWTWPLADAGLQAFPEEAPQVTARSLFRRESGGRSPMELAFGRLDAEASALLEDWGRAHPGDALVPALVQGWIAEVRTTLERELGGGGRTPGQGEDEVRIGTTEARTSEAATTGAATTGAATTEAATGTIEAGVLREARALGGEGEWLRYFARNSKSFRFSARLFPPEEGRLVSGVYAFCRFTDDLVDEADGLDPDALRARLAFWARLVRQAWTSQDTGIPLLDEVMGETARRRVSVLYAEELIRGMAMDLDPIEYPDLIQLRGYSYRVASVVGVWLSELFGTHAPAVLRRAEAMGHAMQLTNILRDVGEDWRRGRLYLPLDRMAAAGVTRDALAAAVEGRAPLPPGWIPLMEGLLQEAERDYALAFEAIPALPHFFQRPVAVAGRVYEGIHREIRALGYNTLTARAYTSLPRKVVLGSRALWDLRREGARARARRARGGFGWDFLSTPSP
jgi:15-cis-phytoene synthase